MKIVSDVAPDIVNQLKHKILNQVFKGYILTESHG